MKLLIRSQTSTVAMRKFGSGSVISSHILQGMWLLIQAGIYGITLTHASKSGHRWPVNSPHKGPTTRKIFPFYDVIMSQIPSNGTWVIHLGNDEAFLRYNATEG